MVEYQSADHEQLMKRLRPAPSVEEVLALVAINGGTKVSDKKFVVTTELLMRKLLELDGIKAEGEARLQRKAEIVHYVIALFRVDFTGRGELAERQQKLAQMLSRLIKIAEEFNVAIYMTNQDLWAYTERLLQTLRMKNLHLEGFPELFQLPTWIEGATDTTL